MKFITKLKLKNFKRFNSFAVDFDDNINILVGDNESGKSSLIEAISLVLSGSRSKVETTGLENIFNSTAISDFLASDKKYENLPNVFIEVYFNEQHNIELSGKNLKINGEKQPSNIWNKYKDLFEQETGMPLSKDTKLVFEIEGKTSNRKFKSF